ncbi:MAG TPA: hypothetical protein VNO26_02575 [Candidatus Limnocylindria bacterium]|nr:hypothetical protein [Candidatus Limnocylindria bacterium]
MPPTILPAVIGVAPDFTLATPLAALGPIVWATSDLVVLFLALYITRTSAAKRLGPPGDPPLRDAA